MNTDKYFESPEEFQNNPVYFVQHRVCNSPVLAQITLAQVRLEEGDTKSCYEKLEQAEEEIKNIGKFIRTFAKEYEEYKNKKN